MQGAGRSSLRPLSPLPSPALLSPPHRSAPVSRAAAALQSPSSEQVQPPPETRTAASLSRRPHGGLPQARPADAAGAEGHGQPAPHQFHQGHDRGRLGVSEGGGCAATQPRPHTGDTLPHMGTASGLGMVLGGLCGAPAARRFSGAPGAEPRWLGPLPARGAGLRRARPGARGWGAGRAGPPAPAPADAELAHGEMAAGGSAGTARPGRATAVAVPEGVVTGREAGNAKLVQDWKPKNLCPRRKRLLFHCVPVSWN